jgi:hypothetical protein
MNNEEYNMQIIPLPFNTGLILERILGIETSSQNLYLKMANTSSSICLLQVFQYIL